MPDPLHPDPRSPEGQMIAYAIEQGYLRRLDLEEARLKLAKHPAGRESGALLRLLRARYLEEAHLDELRRHYQQTKAAILRAAEEAELEVLSISDILVGPPFSISDTGEVEVHPELGSGTHATRQPAPAPGPDSAHEPAHEPIVLDETPQPAPQARPAWLLPALIATAVVVLGVAAWLSLG